MTMVSTGPISIGGSATSGGLNQSINIELGRAATATSSLNETALRTLAGVPSGAISLFNFYGKSNTFSFTLTGSDINLRTAAIAAGWDQSTAVQATINSGVVVSASSTGTPAITVNGSWPGGVTLINNGTIAGMGGGGAPGRGSVLPSPPAIPNGSAGGTALSVSVPISIQNNGTVAGGGGGGGGGAGARTVTSRPSADVRLGGGGGGGGRSGNTSSAGGPGGSASGGTLNFPGSVGGSGTAPSAGGGGAGGNRPNPGTGAAWGSGGTGGAGGAYGSTGGNGGTWSTTPAANPGFAGSSGGGGGPCTAGNSFITWTVTGTRLGALN